MMRVVGALESGFSHPTWRKVEGLLIGPLWALWRRTGPAARRQRGWHEASHGGLSPQGLHRARWSAVEWSRRVVWLVVRTVVAVGGERTFVIDETGARRGGPRLTRRGHDREPLAASRQRAGATSGWRWIVWTLVITPPWTLRPWAVPVLRVPAPTPAVSRRLGRRHATVPPRARPMLLGGRRWVPGMAMPVIGGHSYRVHERGQAGARWGVRWGAPLRLEAALSGPAGAPRPGPKGRPRVKGARLPPRAQGLKGAQTPGQRRRVRWYNGRRRELDVTSGTAVWDRSGQPVRPLRWMLVRAPHGRLGPRAYVATGPNDRPRAVGQRFITRWTIATTVEASRAPLGLATQCQGSDRASERPTPCLWGRYSVVTRLAHARHPDGKGPGPNVAWYPQAHATFADVLAVVRRHFWGDFRDSTSAHPPDLVESPRSELARWVQAGCYAHGQVQSRAQSEHERADKVEHKKRGRRIFPKFYWH
jgi:hypothetical protein